ncbi:hypothetical protein LWI28_007312 [Acer negundo]|uniref:alcohol dehydrogenase n=1 Tax=Acer negundo TaxID=4023 RepID=A0AAD5NUB8_ACENE|nr:hypothetical protein LWI28_007312 [Acer negundo]
MKQEGCVAKIYPAAPFDKVCVLSCGISTGLGATLKVAKPKKGSSVAIFGLGAIGLAAAEGARIAAKKFGVTEFVNPKDYDKPVQEGWGVAVLVGVPNKDDAFKERTLRGTFFGNYKPRADLPSVVEKYMNKELELEKFITHEVPLSEINKAFEYMLRGDGLRSTSPSPAAGDPPSPAAVNFSSGQRAAISLLPAAGDSLLPAGGDSLLQLLRRLQLSFSSSPPTSPKSPSCAVE